MLTEEPPPNRVLAGAADFGRCSLRRERQFHAVASPSGTRLHLRHVPAVATLHNVQPVRRAHRNQRKLMKGRRLTQNRRCRTPHGHWWLALRDTFYDRRVYCSGTTTCSANRRGCARPKPKPRQERGWTPTHKHGPS